MTGRIPTPIVYGGESRTAAEWAAFLDVSIQIVRRRTKRGLPLVRDLDRSAPSAWGEQIEHEGRSLTQAEWAREVGVSRQTMWNRLHRGWPVGKAIGTPRAAWRCGTGAGKRSPIRARQPADLLASETPGAYFWGYRPPRPR